jgi:hypothetical protein
MKNAIFEVLEAHRPILKKCSVELPLTMPCTCGTIINVIGNENPITAHRRHIAEVAENAVSPRTVLVSTSGGSTGWDHSAWLKIHDGQEITR